MTSQFIVAVGVLFLSVGIAAGYVTLDVLTRRAPGRQRLRGAGDTDGLFEASLPLANSALDPRLARATRFLPRSPKEMGRLQRRMSRAGYHGATPTITYAAAEIALP